MTDMPDHGDPLREAINRASASARSAAEQLFEQITASSRASAERMIEQATASSHESTRSLIEQATASNQEAIRSLIEQAGMQSMLSTLSSDILAWSARPTQPARDLVGAVQHVNSSWVQAAAKVRAALAELAAAQMAVSGFTAATAMGGRAQLAVSPVRAGATVGRPLLSMPAASALEEMDAPDLRVLLRKLGSMLYTATSNSALQFAVTTLISLVMLVIAIIALNTSQAAYELARENASNDQQREVTAPSSNAQPAPMTAVPGQREIDDQERGAELDPGQ